MEKIKVALIFRSKERNEFSIETLFGCLKPYLNDKFITEDYFLPCGRYNQIKALAKNLKYAKQINADIYHITGEVNFVASVLPKNRSIITVHDYVDLENMKGLKKYIRWLFWCYLPYKRCQYIACISHKTMQETIRRFPFTQNKVVYIPNPIGDNYQFSYREFNTVNPQILIIGTRVNKNLERIIEAVRGVECTLYIIGVLNDKQKELLNTYHIEYQNVYHITEDEVRNAYCNSDLVCFPSTYEGFGRPIIEANAIGRVVVTSNIEPMVEVANGTSILVNPYDVEAIKTGILQALTDVELREKLIELGLMNAKEYKASIVADKYSKLYCQELL